MPTSFDPYHRWLGIPAEEQPANHYRLLGLALFESDPEVIRDAAERQIAHVRGYSLGKHSDLSQKVLNELGKAKACLLNEKEKADYDCKLSETIESQQAKTASLSPKTSASAAADPIPVVSRVAGKTSVTPRHPNWQMAAIGGAVALFAGLLLVALFLFGDVGGNNDTTVGENAPEAPSDTARSRPGPKSVSASPTASPRAVEDVASTTTPTSNADDTARIDDVTPSTDVDATGTPLAEANSGETDIQTSPITPVPVDIPSPEDAASAKQLIWGEYGNDIETATTVGQRIAVARRMFQAASVASEGAPKRFVLLTETQRLAVAAEDAAFVNEIMDRLARDFTVEEVTESTSAWEKKAAILKQLSRRAEASQDSATVAEAALATADLAARDGKLDLAKSIVALAIGDAYKADDVELFRKATLRLLDLDEGKIAANAPVVPTHAVGGQPAKSEKTEAVGGKGPNAFESLAPPHHVLVGLNVSEGNFQRYHVIWSVQAVYASLDGNVVESKTYGAPGDKMTELLARPGYAVGGILVKSGLLVDGFQVIFMRIGSEGLVPDDSYESEWVGGRGGEKQQKLGGDGKPVVGIYGEHGRIVARLGLIQQQ